MRSATTLPSLCAVFDRARERIPRADVPRLVMSDPGSAGYVAAYTRVLIGGLPALLEETSSGLPLIGSFDITENLLLSHTDAGSSVSHRWFSVLTACIELLGASAYRFASFSASLGTLLADSFALKDANVVGAPTDLLPLVCRELKESASNPHEATLALLGELFTAPLTDTEVDSLCQEISRRHEESQQWYTEDGEPNPFYAARPELVWGGAVVSRHELRRWLDLTKKHFPSPSSSELAKRMREQLLRDGEGWRRRARDR